MTTKFWVGTSGWHYNHWRGSFYPPDLPPGKWLDYYVAQFRTVELNNSFYRQPKDQTWQGWQKAVPEGFIFAVKASRFITHIKRLRDCAEPLKTFLNGAILLGDHLGPILYQMPPSFHRTPANVERLAAILPLLPAELRHVFELRHASWFVEETMTLLRQHNIGFCAFDMVGCDCPLTATAGFAYIRFHGAEARYASNYPDQQLQMWAERLKSLAATHNLTEVYIYFNNDFNAYAVFNAKTLIALLGAR